MAVEQDTVLGHISQSAAANGRKRAVRHTQRHGQRAITGHEIGECVRSPT